MSINKENEKNISLPIFLYYLTTVNFNDIKPIYNVNTKEGLMPILGFVYKPILFL
ncbi:MAG: hypothetical protein LBV69_08285 [Bacteroidales bacterium]|jgi:hypothetical protein|nr:hypothetical protein [Bacteroidales bacterium]